MTRLRGGARADAWRHYHQWHPPVVLPLNFPPTAPRDQTPWMNEAACNGTDPEAWFLDPGEHMAQQHIAICAKCPVRDACLTYALDNDLPGIWGGTTELQRRSMKKKRNRA